MQQYIAPRYDFIVVGGGTAGCIMAARLSERASKQVLLIEAGEDTPPDRTPADIDDIFPRSTANPTYLWKGMKATVKAGQAPRPYPQGKVMGGGSSVNGLVALRGQESDYERWVAAGADGWSWDDVLPWFRRIEQDQDRDGPASSSAGDPIRHVAEAQWPCYVRAVRDAASYAGFSYNRDVNESPGDGFYPMPISATKDARATSANSYLDAATRRRPNLTIMPLTHVETLLLEGSRVTGVKVKRDTESSDIHADAVVLSAGAIQSPALLLRSGIGPAEALKLVGVEPRCHRAGVGANLQNHPYVLTGVVLPRRMRMAPELRYFSIAGLRASSHQADTLGGDLFLFLTGRISPRAVGASLGIVGAGLYSPVSRGSVTLAGADPQQDPRVDFNMLDDERDRSRLIEGVRLAHRLLSSPDVKPTIKDTFLLPPVQAINEFGNPGVVGALFSAGAEVFVRMPAALRHLVLDIGVGRSKRLTPRRTPSDQDVLDCVSPMGHPAGTCAIGHADDDQAVVDAHCKLHGLSGLYVADASVIPVLPSANTNLPTMMVAERVAAWLNSAA